MGVWACLPRQLSDHSAGMVKSFVQLASGMESNSQMLRDGILKTNDALDAFVEENFVEQVDIPASIKYISDMTNASSQLIGTPTRDEEAPVPKHSCQYIARGELVQFVCKCGCGQIF